MLQHKADLLQLRTGTLVPRTWFRGTSKLALHAQAICRGLLLFSVGSL
jgi:hypothetical protein